jgi:hypothetical protein
LALCRSAGRAGRRAGEGVVAAVDLLPVRVTRRWAAVAWRLLKVTVHSVFPVPPQPTCWAVGVGGAVTVAVIGGIVARPCLSVASCTSGETPDWAATGF